MNLFKAIDLLLKKPKGSRLFAFNQAQKIGIPFNAPHGFRFLSISDSVIKSYAPYKKLNQNHVKGIHACAIATVGEMAAGVLLIKNFTAYRYRFILANLEVDYHYQGRTDLIGTCIFNDEEKERTAKILEADEIPIVEMYTRITDSKDNHIADVRTFWQLKDWKQVKTK